MTRFAHISDLHLNGSRSRQSNVHRELQRAAAANIDHLLITGDLTSSGRLGQFMELSELLGDWRPEAVTIVPGNHDGGRRRWDQALSGPLYRFAPTSAPGAVADLGDAIVVALSTQAHSRALLFRAAGWVSDAELAVVDYVTRQPSQGRAVVLAMHHGPQLHPFQPFDGLRNRSLIKAFLARGPHISVCCGHDHRIVDRDRIHAAASVAHHSDALRLYDVVSGKLTPSYRSRFSGSSLP